MIRPYASTWAVDGERHRLDGPAVIHADGTAEWWVDGIRIHGQDADRLDELHAAGELTLLATVLAGWTPGADLQALVAAGLSRG